MKFFVIALLGTLAASAQGLTVGGAAALTSWGSKFEPLPAWGTRVHPVGIVDLQLHLNSTRTHPFLELAGDPHRPGEASSIAAGLRRDLLGSKHAAVFGQVSVGVFKGPSFAEYGCTYEYPYCRITGPPEECWWASVNVGLGVREPVSRYWALEQKVEYLSPYGIGPRWRIAAGFRYTLHVPKSLTN